MLPRSSILILLILLSACGQEGSQERWTRTPEQLPPFRSDKRKAHHALFYNCENLFDTVDAKGVKDDSYTPAGEYAWNSDRYRSKLQRIAKVIGTFASSPALVGLCEVENEHVLKDLCSDTQLERAAYGFLHHESRDPRGIDLALLYDPKRFHPYDRKAFKIENPGSGTPTRPILSIGLETANADSLRVFLCHWPSRAGGKAASEPDRMNASQVLQEALKELHRDHSTRKVLIMGDLNDHPTDASVQKLLNGDHGFVLEDLFAEAHRNGKGTYNYRGEWGVLDHFIVNEELMEASEGIRYRKGNARILREEELLYFDQEGGHYQPDRFMERGDYYGGYSDHLPILLQLRPGQ